jgi:hypothetical protein
MFSRVALSGCALLAAMVGLSGCATDPDKIYAQALGVQCSQSQGGLTALTCANTPPGKGIAQVSRYCYATIGSSNCFDRPDTDRKNQALGSSGY